MLRSALLYLSDRQGVFRFIRNNRFARGLARRFVAGEELGDALQVAEELNRRGISCSLDLLGESVSSAQEARSAAREYIRVLDGIHERGLDSHISIKLTALGLDISEDLCVSAMRELLDRAAGCGNFVRIDMEGSAYTEPTLRLFEEHFFPGYPEHVGIVLQSYLYRTMPDVERAIRLRARVRLCKGAYKEPPAVAFHDKKDVDANYVRGMRRLMLDGNYPAIATHDEPIISEARRFAKEKGISSDRYEFQMLYGVRRDLQEQLVSQGYRMRVYIPFGTQWYPYLMRRLAERPANIAFMTGSVVREAFRRRRR